MIGDDEAGKFRARIKELELRLLNVINVHEGTREENRQLLHRLMESESDNARVVTRLSTVLRELEQLEDVEAQNRALLAALKYKGRRSD